MTMSEAKPLIHIRIRDLRREHSLTQEELAAALGLSRQSINAMEAGRCLPSLPVALQIASFFSVPLNMVIAENILNSENQHNSQEESPMASNSHLTPWSPLREMREALDELIDDSKLWNSPTLPAGPAVNIYQTETEVIIEASLPGYQKDELSLEVGEDFLVIIGQPSVQESNKNYFRQEFSLSGFKRAVALPALVNTEETAAEMKQGILIVRLQKIVEEKPKTAKIHIKESE